MKDKEKTQCLLEISDAPSSNIWPVKTVESFSDEATIPADYDIDHVAVASVVATDATTTITTK